MNRIILEILLILSKNRVFKPCFFRTEQDKSKKKSWKSC